MYRFWMVVNVAEYWRHRYGQALPPREAPRFIHEDQAAAETELLRLAEENPEGEFVLLEAVASAERNLGNALFVRYLRGDFYGPN